MVKSITFKDNTLSLENQLLKYKDKSKILVYEMFDTCYTIYYLNFLLSIMMLIKIMGFYHIFRHKLYLNPYPHFSFFITNFLILLL